MRSSLRRRLDRLERKMPDPGPEELRARLAAMSDDELAFFAATMWRTTLVQGGMRDERFLAFAGNEGVIGYLHGALGFDYARANPEEVAAAWPQAVHTFLRFGRGGCRRCHCPECAVRGRWGYHSFRPGAPAWQPPPGEADGELSPNGEELYPIDRPEIWPSGPSQAQRSSSRKDARQ